MRYSLLVFFLLPALAIGQINISETEVPEGVKIGKSKGVVLSKYDSMYIVSYQDQKYQLITEIKSFHWYGTDKDLRVLYSTIMNGFNDPEKYRSFEVENGHVSLSYYTVMGVTSFQFVFVNTQTNITSSTAFLTARQVSKLFDRR